MRTESAPMTIAKEAKQVKIKLKNGARMPEAGAEREVRDATEKKRYRRCLASTGVGPPHKRGTGLRLHTGDVFTPTKSAPHASETTEIV